MGGGTPDACPIKNLLYRIPKSPWNIASLSHISLFPPLFFSPSLNPYMGGQVRDLCEAGNVSASFLFISRTQALSIIFTL